LEFDNASSSTWQDIGHYQLSLYSEGRIGYSGDGYFGFDTVELAWQGSGGPSLDGQVVGAITTKDFYIGRLPLTPRPTNFTDYNHPHPSILGTLTNQSKVPSSSWAYTAGARYKAEEIFGSLTFGGYDASRFVPNNVSFSFGADISYDLLVALRSIKTGKADLLTNQIFAFINSNVPHIWLPMDACKAFEAVFGLTHDPTTDLYLVNDTHHNQLLAANANIIFTLAPSFSAGPAVDIVLPYGSFDLNVVLPSNITSHYFPIRRAQNSSQYTLGRTFFQEA
jgi:hypothetical protein